MTAPRTDPPTDDCEHARDEHNEFGCFHGNCPCSVPWEFVDNVHPAPRTDPQSTVPVEPLSDGDKLRVLAAWFDMWDRPETDRQAILDDPRNPGRNDVQRDLVRIAATLDAARASQPITPTALYRVVGSVVTDARVAELMRAAAIPLHGHPIHNEAGYVAALIRADLVDGVNKVLAALPVREDEPTGIDRLAASWEAAADLIEGRAGMGDISAAMATYQTLRSCAAELREASHVR